MRNGSLLEATPPEYEELNNWKNPLQTAISDQNMKEADQLGSSLKDFQSNNPDKLSASGRLHAKFEQVCPDPVIFIL